MQHSAGTVSGKSGMDGLYSDDATHSVRSGMESCLPIPDYARKAINSALHAFQAPGGRSGCSARTGRLHAALLFISALAQPDFTAPSAAEKTRKKTVGKKSG